jgi:hypothetical protein
MAEKRLINYDDEEKQEYNESSRPRIAQSPLSSSAAAISSMFSPGSSPPTLNLQPLSSQTSHLSRFRLPPPASPLSASYRSLPPAPYPPVALGAPRQISLRPEFLEPAGEIEQKFTTAILSTNEALSHLFQSGIAQDRPSSEIRDDASTLLSIAGQVVSENRQIMEELLDKRDQIQIEAQIERIVPCVVVSVKSFGILRYKSYSLNLAHMLKYQ